MGHFLPGSFFMGFGFWWLLGALHRFYRGRFGGGPQFHATLTYPCLCCPHQSSRFQIEGFVKVIFASMGLIMELITAFDEEKFLFIGNAQHATMYAFFGFSGIIDIMMHHGAPFPKFTDYVYLLLCFAVEGLLFTFHLHGRSALDKSVHHLLVYTIWCCVFATFGEIRFPSSIFCTLARCFFVMLQGSWLVQIGIVLYPPIDGMKQWQGDDDRDVMLITIVFAWHLFFVFFFMCSTSVLIVRIHARNNDNRNDGAETYVQLGTKREIDEECLIESNEIELDEIECDGSN